MAEKARLEEIERNRRYFDPVTKTTFVPKPLTENTVGRKVMKT